MSTEPSNIRISGQAQQATETTATEAVVEQVATTTENSEESTEQTPEVTITSETDKSETTTDETKTQTVDSTKQESNEEEIKVTVTAEEIKKEEVVADDIWSKLGMSEKEFNELKQIKEERSKPDTESKAFADLTQYVVDKKLATKDEIIAFENIQKTDDKTLVFDKFKAAQLAENSEMSDEDILYNFETEYNLNSDNERQKQRGLKALADEASEIRKPIVDKINSFKKDFVIGSNMSAFTQQQKTIVEEFNKHKITKTVSVNGKKITVEVEPAISFEEVKQHFSKTDEGKVQNNLLFEAFVQDRTQSEQALGQLITNMANSKSEAKLLQAIADKAFEQGQESVKEKSPGAKAPFNSKQETVLANNPEQVDETAQYREYKKRNF